MPVISVIVPVYKVEAYLDRCVRSVLAQTYRDFELILVDDGSPDRCGEYCDAYARADARIHVIHQGNAGLSAARNAGIDWAFANSDSQWLTFIDSDDWVHPQMVEQLLAAAQEHAAKVSVCGFARTEGEDPWSNQEIPHAEVWESSVFYQTHFINATVAWGKLYRRSCFASNRYPVGKIHEDEFLTYKLLFAQESVAVVAAPLYAYFMNDTGITRSAWNPKRLDAWEAYEQQLTFFAARGDMELVRFRYRGYLENAMTNLRSAQTAPNAAELRPVIRRMKKRIRNVIRRAWKCGSMDFWIDYELLYQFYPLLTRLYRWWIDRPRRKKHA